MISGSREPVAEQKYPEDSVQSYTGEWWVRDDRRTACRGRLVRAFVPYPEQKPHRLVPESRGSNPTDHSRAVVRIEPVRIGQPSSGGGLPVPALPLYSGESYFVQRGKVRPALIVALAGADVPKGLRPAGEATHQTAPTLLMAPYYGSEKSGTRAGWHQPLVERIRRAEYPQYVWDRLPLPGASESILRLDHVFPVSTDPATFELTDFRLSEGAISMIDEWLHWRVTGRFLDGSILADVRTALLS